MKFLCVLTWFFLFQLGFVSLVAGQPAESKSSTEYLQRIHQGDLIDIRVSGHLDFDWRGGITPEGFLDGFDKIPKQIFARCRTVSEVASEITKELAATIRNPKTEVKIVDISNRSPAILDGAIAVPTRFQIRREPTLIELIAAAGGVTDRSSGKISVFRPPNSSCSQNSPINADSQKLGPTEISIEALLSGDASANIPIVSGDLVVVSEALPIYIVGAVGTQGRMDHRPELTVRRVVDSAGGALKDAVLKGVTIFRRGKSTSEAIRVSLEKGSPDVFLQPFDIIDVPFKGRPPRKLPPIAEIESETERERSRYPLKIIE